MASTKPKPEREVLPEHGGEPEFFLPVPYKAEMVEGTQDLRVYWGTIRGRYIKPEFTVVGPVAVMARNSRRLMELSADAHNIAQWAADMENGQGH